MDEIFNLLATVNISFIDNHDLTESTFTPSPLTQINKILNSFDFIPVTNFDLEKFRKIFDSSQILSPTTLTSDFYGMLPLIKSGKLLYSLSREGPGTEKFHRNCAQKGPTLTIVKANGGYIFGGYNPYSYITENAYLNSPNAFLFSLTDGRNRRPIKFPVVASRSEYAIRCCESQWSPGFGEEGISDLFIAFKNPKNSYSRLGIAYEVPHGYGPGEEILAGRKDGWNVEEVEVYAVEVAQE